MPKAVFQHIVAIICNRSVSRHRHFRLSLERFKIIILIIAAYTLFSLRCAYEKSSLSLIFFQAGEFKRWGASHENHRKYRTRVFPLLSGTSFVALA
ncbi:MAG TPA: hypothetical protein PLK99_01885, partial [Burkholderiales bacterium]|nr:hypothetical protein [Burkholderiales bacterium]